MFLIPDRHLMMKPFVFTLLISVVNLTETSGQLPFSDGQIIFKDGKKISCQIQLATGYDSIVTYKVRGNPNEIIADIHQIQSLNTSYNSFLNFTVNGKEFLMRKVSTGIAELYSHIMNVKPRPQSSTNGEEKEQTNQAKTQKGKNSLTRTSTKLEGAYWLETKTFYVLKLKETHYIIEKQNFNDLSEILRSKDYIVNKITSGKYTFKDMPKIINEFNAN